jgi:hypothetical protein
LRTKNYTEMKKRREHATVAELPFDRTTMDVVCERVETGETNSWTPTAETVALATAGGAPSPAAASRAVRCSR